jgi:hypothetical protein
MAVLTATQKWAAVLWAVAIAVTVELFFPLFWWHPGCNHQVAHSVYPGVGFPFPYGQFSGTSEDQALVMPHVYLANIIILSTVLFVILRGCLSSFGGRGAVASRVALGLGGIALLVMVAFQGLIALTDYVPVTSIGGKPDSYLSYRPEFIALHGSNQACAKGA